MEDITACAVWFALTDSWLLGEVLVNGFDLKMVLNLPIFETASFLRWFYASNCQPRCLN